MFDLKKTSLYFFFKLGNKQNCYQNNHKKLKSDIKNIKFDENDNSPQNIYNIYLFANQKNAGYCYYAKRDEYN